MTLFQRRDSYNYLKGRPDVVKYIRKLTYKVGRSGSISVYSSFRDDRRLSPILPNFLRTFSRLNCLEITASDLDWNFLDSSLRSLTSAFLHLMHLPTINHIGLPHMENFPLSSLTPSVKLHRLDLSHVHPLEEDASPETVQLEMVPNIHEFHTTESPLLTTKLLHSTY